jgi:outer membrane autotransporter protein
MHRMLFLAACGATLLSLHARAEFFVGAAGGVSDWPNAVCSEAASSCDHRGTTWLVRGGYMFLPYLGLEARYVDLGRTSASFSSVTNGAATSTDSHFTSKGAAIGAVAAVPISEGFAFVAVAGAARLKTRFEVPGTESPALDGSGIVTTPAFHADDTKTNPYYGLGVDYRVAPNMSVGVEATRYRVQFGGKDNVDTFTASLTFHFR